MAQAGKFWASFSPKATLNFRLFTNCRTITKIVAHSFVPCTSSLVRTTDDNWWYLHVKDIWSSISYPAWALDNIFFAPNIYMQVNHNQHISQGSTLQTNFAFYFQYLESREMISPDKEFVVLYIIQKRCSDTKKKKLNHLADTVK